jgi:hypothetical protein
MVIVKKDLCSTPSRNACSSLNPRKLRRERAGTREGARKESEPSTRLTKEGCISRFGFVVSFAAVELEFVVRLPSKTCRSRNRKGIPSAQACLIQHAHQTALGKHPAARHLGFQINRNSIVPPQMLCCPSSLHRELRLLSF